MKIKKILLFLFFVCILVSSVSCQKKPYWLKEGVYFKYSFKDDPETDRSTASLILLDGTDLRCMGTGYLRWDVLELKENYATIKVTIKIGDIEISPPDPMEEPYHEDEMIFSETVTVDIEKMEYVDDEVPWGKCLLWIDPAYTIDDLKDMKMAYNIKGEELNVEKVNVRDCEMHTYYHTFKPPVIELWSRMIEFKLSNTEFGTTAVRQYDTASGAMIAWAMGPSDLLTRMGFIMVVFFDEVSSNRAWKAHEEGREEYWGYGCILEETNAELFKEAEGSEWSPSSWSLIILIIVLGIALSIFIYKRKK